MVLLASLIFPSKRPTAKGPPLSAFAEALRKGIKFLDQKLCIEIDLDVSESQSSE